MPDTNPDAVKEQQVKAIASEIKSLRGWLDYLERDIANDKGVIHVLLLISISESCTKLIYSAGVFNGATFSKE